MISIARILGAPVIEPPGKTARITSTGPTPGAEPALDRRDQVVDLGEALDGQRIDDPDRAVPADPAQVVAFQVDDHGQLGPVLGRCGQLGGEPRVFLGDRCRGAASP